MSEKEFVKIAGEDAWWRYSKGTIFNAPHEKNIVKDKELISWNKGFFISKRHAYQRNMIAY